nr:hypothetical protein [Tanacetum cinerariifolium]
MSTLKFAEVHNLVVFLSKPTECEGFEQIVDFLNANPIQYALTVNPIVYISCIVQFWTTTKAKTINREVQLQALVDGNKVIITESTDSGNINKTQYKATPNESSFQGTDSVGGPRCQEAMGDTTAQTRVLDLETTKTTQAMEIESLKKGTHDDAEMFDVDKNLGGEEVFVVQQDKNVVEKEVDVAQVQVTTAATTPIISIDKVTLAQALAKLKHTKPKAKAKGIVFHEPEESTTTTIPKPKSQDKELQDKFENEQRLASEKAQQKQEANIALIESWDDVQAKIDTDYQLAERLQAKEQQEFNDEEKAKLFMQLLEKRRKFYAAKRAEEKRNKPPTQAQQRKIMCTYLKNIKGKKLTNLKNKSFDSIQKMFDKAFKMVNIFVDYRTKLVEESSKKAKAEVMKGSSKRAGTKLEQKSSKKQKIDDDIDTPKLKYHMLKEFDREDVETLRKLVKAKYGSTRPEGDYERVLWGDLKVMFDPYVEDEVWKMQQRYNVVR